MVTIKWLARVLKGLITGDTPERRHYERSDIQHARQHINQLQQQLELIERRAELKRRESR